MSEDFDVETVGGHVTRERGRGRPTALETELRLRHQIEDLKRENAELRARMADHFFAMSVPLGGA